MNRESEARFSMLPQIEKPRSIFDRSNQVKTSFNCGDLIPVEVWNDVMPGDTIQMNVGEVLRQTSALKTPVLDNAYLDIFFFFVPNRLVFNKWEEFMGANDDPWARTDTITIPQITAPSGGWATGTIADYFGIPTKRDGISVDRLPFNAYCKIWNDYFRDQNTQYSLDFNTDAVDIVGVNTNNYTTDCCKGGKPAKVNKFHDYFTSCLPYPQKHADVLLPLGSTAPVVGNGMTIGLTMNNTNYGLTNRYDSNFGSRLAMNTQGIGVQENTTVSKNYYCDTDNKTIGLTTDGTKSGIVADLSSATAATISQLYQAFALQKLYEADARGGTRYNEIIYSHFGVTSPDQRLQRAEYLGGQRIAINKDQVVATSGTDNQDLGSLGAYSVTGGTDDSFTYSAQEFGILMCLASVRCEHSYQQGINRMWSRKYREDYYFPELANIGEQAVLNKEIYAQGTDVDNEVFGYQEAWADYRYKPSRVSGQMRSNADGTLDCWHYGDNYESKPTLSPTWLEEPTTNMDRTLAVTSENADQFILDIFFKTKWTREMPLYSIPGLPV